MSGAKWIIIFSLAVILLMTNFVSAKPPKSASSSTKSTNQNNQSKNSTVAHDHHHHKNSTHHHGHQQHQNHSAPNPEIGWSLHNNDPHHHKPAAESSPHLAMDQSHHSHNPAVNHPGPSQTAHAHAPASAPVPETGSGSSALAAGLGGAALGAIGGAAGGYLLSNALNNNEKSEETVSTATETTIAASESTLSAAISSVSEIESHSTLELKTSTIVSDPIVANEHDNSTSNATVSAVSDTTPAQIDEHKIKVDENAVQQTTEAAAVDSLPNVESKINVPQQDPMSTAAAPTVTTSENSGNYVAHKSHLLTLSTLLLFAVKYFQLY